MIKRFPVLSATYFELKRLWEGDEPGPHVVFGDALTPYAVRLFEAGNDEELSRVFAFVEELAAAPQAAIREVVATSVLETIVLDRGIGSRVDKYLGPASMEMARKIREDW